MPYWHIKTHSHLWKVLKIRNWNHVVVKCCVILENSNEMQTVPKWRTRGSVLSDLYIYIDGSKTVRAETWNVICWSLKISLCQSSETSFRARRVRCHWRKTQLIPDVLLSYWISMVLLFGASQTRSLRYRRRNDVFRRSENRHECLSCIFGEGVVLLL